LAKGAKFIGNSIKGLSAQITGWTADGISIQLMSSPMGHDRPTEPCAGLA
jgi:hypothetical protein